MKNKTKHKIIEDNYIFISIKMNITVRLAGNVPGTGMQQLNGTKINIYNLFGNQ